MSTTPYGGYGKSEEERDLEQIRYRRALVTLRLLQGAFALAVLVLLATTVYVAVEMRATQLEGTPTGKKLLHGADRILSCTDVNGTCAKENRAKQAALITELIDAQSRAAAAATACADQPGRQTYQEIFACVLDKMPPPEEQ